MCVNMLPVHDQYKNAKDLAERRRIQAAVIEANRARVRAFVRRFVPRKQDWADGEQEGLLGVLLALEKWDPTRPRYSDNAFWGFAYLYVRQQIRTWLDQGYYWRKSPNRGKSERRVRTAAEVRRTRVFLSLNVRPNSERDEELIDLLADPCHR
jgi:DNA-directed RNA polymerase specialized sigma subunit